MQRFLVFIILSVISSTQSKPPEIPEEIDGVDACLASSGVDPKVPENAFIRGEFTPDEKFKCFLKCMFITMGDMTESGELLRDNMKSHAPPGITQDQANKIVDDCTTTSDGSDPCDVAYNSAKCMYDAAMKL